MPEHPGQISAVFLTGFMGAGKTTVGQILARRLGCAFVDLDDEIVRAADRSISQIFDQQGEAEFRRLEADALRSVLGRLESEPAVIALGGGTFADRSNLSSLASLPHPTIFLDASADELLARCRTSSLQGAPERPLQRNENQFRQLFQQRLPAYMEADVRIDTTGRNPQQIADELLRLLASWSSRSK